MTVAATLAEITEPTPGKSLIRLAAAIFPPAAARSVVELTSLAAWGFRDVMDGGDLGQERGLRWDEHDRVCEGDGRGATPPAKATAPAIQDRAYRALIDRSI